jgi:hypothetical protein
MRGWVCHLQLLLALASAFILSSEFRGTHNHILQSQIRDFLLCRLLWLAGLRWKYLTPPPHGLGNTENTAFDRSSVVALDLMPWEQVCLRRCYSAKGVYICLLGICCLAADVVALFVSRSICSNGSHTAIYVHIWNHQFWVILRLLIIRHVYYLICYIWATHSVAFNV